MLKTDHLIKKKICKILLNFFKKRGITIQKIILFGSLAKGVQQEDSDIDLIVISKDFRKKGIFKKVSMTRGVNWELVKQTGKPVDVLYYSDIEWRRGQSPLLEAARTEGEMFFSHYD